MNRLMGSFSASLIICALICGPGGSFAQETKSPPKNVTVSADVSGGYHFYNTDGNRSKVGEYDVLGSGAESAFDLKAVRVQAAASIAVAHVVRVKVLKCFQCHPLLNT